jgi:hypothetical protein
MEKVLVISVYFNQENFLDPQIKCLDKYLEDDFQFCFFDNSHNGMYESQKLESEKFKYYRVPQNIFTGGGASTRAGQSLDYAIKKSLSDFPDLNNILILDSDMFPIKKFTFGEFMGGKDFTGIIQHRGKVFYYNNQLVGMRKDKISDWENFSFDTATVEGEATDCGGPLYYFFQKNSHLERKDVFGIHSNQLEKSNSLNWDKIDETDSSGLLREFFEKDCNLNSGKNFSELYDFKFLHFRAGSNWINFGEDTKNTREDNLHQYLKSIL